MGREAELLATNEVHVFWERRHAAESELRSGGDIGLSDQDDAVFYQIRLGLLLQALASKAPVPPSFSILDAGCGKGWFSRALAEIGFRVHGIDASRSAIEHARHASVGATFQVATLAGFRPSEHFDAVVCVDVLIHVTDELEWEASLRNLASAVRPGGLLLVTDTTDRRRRSLGNYIVHRSRNRYLQVISGQGFRHKESLPYRFRTNPLGIHAYQRRW